jgi:thymidine phosphorylase
MKKSTLTLKKLGINTYKEAVVYMRKDCHICKSEGFEVQSRVRISLKEKSIIATLNIIDSDILSNNHASLSKYAWDFLGAKEGDEITISHSHPVESLSFVRSKIYGNELLKNQISEIIKDITLGRYSDIHISSFLTACAGDRMTKEEIISLTKAMVEAGDHLHWDSKVIVDKHCVGGLPANRTTPIIVAIVASFGLTMPKTSSRAITSPAGTADTMEVLAPVKLDLSAIKNVVGKENGCVVWGGSVSLSPADDILIRVEKALDLDSHAQLVASILSKKISAGSNHIVIDIPIGETAKVRSRQMANTLKEYLEFVGESLNVIVKVIFSDGSQPVGRGIGPALEARDIVAVLKCDQDAPQDLRIRALTLAGHIIEFSPDVEIGQGIAIATEILDSGKAWKKFQAICQAQGGMREIPQAKYTHPYKAQISGKITKINNRRIALVAKLAGAPDEKSAGVDLHYFIGDVVKKGDELFTIHTNSEGEMDYVLDYLIQNNDEIIKIEEK